MAAQPQRAATADGGEGNVDAEARREQERWSPLSACSRGLHGPGAERIKHFTAKGRVAANKTVKWRV